MYDQIIKASHDDIGHIKVNCTVKLIKKVYWFLQLQIHWKLS